MGQTEFSLYLYSVLNGRKFCGSSTHTLVQPRLGNVVLIGGGGQPSL
jgi:hypothetical protein